MTDASYYFSVAELTVVAAGANRNIAIFSSIGSQLRFETGYFSGEGPTVILKLTGNNRGRVSSHFERLIAAERAEELLATLRAVERERAAAAARRREREERARAEEALQAAAAERRRIEEENTKKEQERAQLDRQAAEEEQNREHASTEEGAACFGMHYFLQGTGCLGEDYETYDVDNQQGGTWKMTEVRAQPMIAVCLGWTSI